MSSSLAHELNQPLTALAIAARACSQLAHARNLGDQELVHAIDQMAEQAERASELVRRMRQLAARAQPHWSNVALGALVQDTLGLFAAEVAREHIAVELHIADSIPMIRLDRIQLEQVLVNLIRNAVEAMSDMPADRRTLKITASRQESEVLLFVTDTGHGLSPEMAARLFQPYQSSKPHGMGLGLAVSRAILQAHAGRLWVEPAAGPGTTFCLALPLSFRET